VPTPKQVRNFQIMKVVARGLIYGISPKMLAEKLHRKVSWVRLVQNQPRFQAAMDEVEADILRTTEKQISVLWEKGLKTVSKLMDSRSETIRLEAFDRAEKIHLFQQGLGPGGLGRALEEPEEDASDEELLLSQPAIESAFKILESTPKDDAYIDVSALGELSVPAKKTS